MAQIKAEQKRSLLQWSYDGVTIKDANGLNLITSDLGIQLAPDEQSPITDLLTGLVWFQRYVGNDIKSGKITTGSSGFGHNVQFAQPMVWRSFSQEELLGLAQEFREIYTDAKPIAETNQAPSTVTDECILKVMMADDRLATVTRTMTDYTIARLPWSHLS